jgi:hypothetical protein
LFLVLVAGVDADWADTFEQQAFELAVPHVDKTESPSYLEDLEITPHPWHSSDNLTLVQVQGRHILLVVAHNHLDAQLMVRVDIDKNHFHLEPFAEVHHGQRVPEPSCFLVKETDLIEDLIDPLVETLHQGILFLEVGYQQAHHAFVVL